MVVRKIVLRQILRIRRKKIKEKHTERREERQKDERRIDKEEEKLSAAKFREASSSSVGGSYTNSHTSKKKEPTIRVSGISLTIKQGTECREVE